LRVSFIAARSSSESKFDTLALVLRADFFLSLMAVPPVRKTSHWEAYLLYSRFFTDIASLLARQYSSAVAHLEGRSKDDRGGLGNRHEDLGIRTRFLNAAATLRRAS
jgi:hypothetical protein